LKSSLRILALWLASLSLCAVRAEAATPASASAQCAAPEHRRLDFWVGDWDAYEVGVQRHLYPHSFRLALRFWPVLDPAAG
jgi:hypothetical protein